MNVFHAGKMISLKYNASTVYNFEDIECKTAYGFSILTWFCCIWVLYIFIASGRAFQRSHRLVFWLIVSQMFNALVHIIWSSVTSNVNDLLPVYGYMHVLVYLFATFSTQSWSLAIMLNVAAISGLEHFCNSRSLEVSCLCFSHVSHLHRRIQILPILDACTVGSATHCLLLDWIHITVSSHSFMRSSRRYTREAKHDGLFRQGPNHREQYSTSLHYNRRLFLLNRLLTRQKRQQQFPITYLEWTCE